uniref:Uncharacterized protein n=1 Tax=Arundo donax TaxID=35708 RepID=A0A0A9DQY1_ARUDO
MGNLCRCCWSVVLFCRWYCQSIAEGRVGADSSVFRAKDRGEQ